MGSCRAYATFGLGAINFPCDGKFLCRTVYETPYEVFPMNLLKFPCREGDRIFNWVHDVHT